MKKFFVLAMVIAVVFCFSVSVSVYSQTLNDLKRELMEKKRQDSIRKSYNHPKFERWYEPTDYRITPSNPLSKFLSYPYHGCGNEKDVSECIDLKSKGMSVQSINVLRDLCYRIVWDRNGLRKSVLLKTFTREELIEATTSFVDEKGQIMPYVYQAMEAWVCKFSADKNGSHSENNGTILDIPTIPDPDGYSVMRVVKGKIRVIDTQKHIGIYLGSSDYLLVFVDDDEFIFKFIGGNLSRHFYKT